ncbi:hypothetical protein ACNOYE_11065 [Nannocystaceae bacterium ST9]
MSNSKSKLFALALAGACVFGAWKLGTALFTADEAQGTKELVNQVWIDHMPTDQRDMITHLVVLDHPQGKFGAIGQSSTWRHMADVFIWKLEGSQLKIHLPQDSVRAQVGVKTWRCEGEAPEPFELCLQLTNARGGTAMLYSRDDWKIRPHDMTDSLEDIADEYPQLAGVLAEIDEEQTDRLEEVDVEDVQWREGPLPLR